MPIKPNDRVSLRLGLWDSSRIVDAIVLKKIAFMYLVAWNVRASWDGTPPFDDYVKSRWKPAWKLIK